MYWWNVRKWRYPFHLAQTNFRKTTPKLIVLRKKVRLCHYIDGSPKFPDDAKTRLWMGLWLWLTVAYLAIKMLPFYLQQGLVALPNNLISEIVAQHEIPMPIVACDVMYNGQMPPQGYKGSAGPGIDFSTRNGPKLSILESRHITGYVFQRPPFSP